MSATQPKRKSIYGVHPGVAMTQKWIAELKDKTGRTLDEWLKLIKKSGPKDEKARREWLKTEYGLGTNYAWWLAERAEGKGTEVGDPDEYLKAAEGYVEKMFSGSKAGLPMWGVPCFIEVGCWSWITSCWTLAPPPPSFRPTKSPRSVSCRGRSHGVRLSGAGTDWP